VLCKETIGDNVKNAEYAVRGAIVQLAGEISERLKKGEKLPFDKLLYCNIGNPLSLGQPTLSFDRDVVTVALNPKLMESSKISKDAKERAKKFLDEVKYPCAVGAYTSSPGLLTVRESVKKYIEERDGHPSDVNKIFLTDGASDGVRTILNILLRGPQDAIMIPIPQYPLYSALISLLNGTGVPYYLDEEHDWGLDMKDLEANYDKAKADGKTTRAIVVINPGNPTGQVMSEENLKDIVKFCHKNKLIILADEVYQKNIYTDKPFISFKKIIHDMGKPYNEQELVSFHSTSKGIIGECGLRGGYMELDNFDEFVLSQVLKLRSICLCSNAVGQITVLMLKLLNRLRLWLILPRKVSIPLKW
jgi:alanine transaminase